MGVSCDHYPWCIGPHCTGPPLYKTITTHASDIWWPRLETCSNCSPEDPLISDIWWPRCVHLRAHTPTPPVLTSGGWLLTYAGLAGGKHPTRMRSCNKYFCRVLRNFCMVFGVGWFVLMLFSDEVKSSHGNWGFILNIGNDTFHVHQNLRRNSLSKMWNRRS